MTADVSHAKRCDACRRDLAALVAHRLLPAHGPGSVAAALLIGYVELMMQLGAAHLAMKALDEMKTYLAETTQPPLPKIVN